jgi:hypothetical protein
MLRKVICTVLLCAVLLMPSGCLGLVVRTIPDGHEPTLGQELMDLKKARDDGSMTQQEYDTAKVKLLDEKD